MGWKKLPMFPCGCGVDVPKPRGIITAFLTYLYRMGILASSICHTKSGGRGHLKQNAYFHFDDIDLECQPWNSFPVVNLNLLT